MAEQARYFYIAAMDVDPAKEAAFNEVYDTEHVPALLEVPGVLSALRLQAQDGGSPKYLAVYEIAAPDVHSSPAWVAAADSGRWPTEIRPHCTNRNRIVYKVVGPGAD